MVKPIWNNAQKVNHQNFAKKTHPCVKKNLVSRAVLMKSSLVSVNTARQVNIAHSKTTVNATRPMSYLSKTTHSTVKRPINNNTTFKNSNINQMVNTVRGKNVNTARPKAIVNAVQGNNVNAVKASACWVWKLKTKVLDHVSKHNSESTILKRAIHKWIYRIKEDLQLEDAEGVDCLPNSTIFEELTLMGAKTTAWNEFSSTMASAIICLAANQKFNFSKYIFESMVRNLDNLSGKFLMYPRFVQVFLNQQLGDLSTHNGIYIAPSYTKKIFGNIRRVGKGFFGSVTPLFPTMVVQNQSELGEGSAMPTDPHHTPTIIESSTQPQKTQKPRKPKKKDTQVPQPSGPTGHVVDEAVHKELDDSLVRVTTTASSLEAEQDSGGGPRRQETIGDTIAQTRFKNVSKHSNDLLLIRGNTLQSGEDSLKLNELMELCTNLQTRVLDLEKTKTTQAEEIVRVKKLEKKKRSRTHGLKRLYKVGLTDRVESSRDKESLGVDASKQGRINAIDAGKDITLVNDQDDADMFDVNTLTGDEVLAEQEVATKDVNLTVDEVTLAQALAALKSVKPKVKANVVEEPSVPVSATSTKDKGKGFMVESKKLLKKKDQISFDEQEAIRLQAEFDEEKRLAREKDEANFITKQKATLFKELLEQRRKHFAAKRAEEKRNKPPTKTQQKKTMITYLKNMEAAKIKKLMEIVLDEEEVAIDSIPLAIKPPTIIDWKIHKEGKKNYYQIIRANGTKYGSTRPVEDIDFILWGDLKTMFKPHVEDRVWRNQQDYRVLDWKLYDSCGVHSLRMQHMHIYMLVEKRYPLTPAIITDMLNKKLQCDHFSEMAYQLLKLLTK
ncbi:hypothetical protein Tco_1004203 [Tanacetum coccineum]|uniref:Uncharacterized protein n=1 Tax=Tanacetum coccineum TaxID=301880 RepID=A0ABQ5FBG5_9ASTR